MSIETIQISASLATIFTVLFFVVKLSRQYQSMEDKDSRQDEKIGILESRLVKIDEHIERLYERTNVNEKFYIEIKTKLEHIEALIQNRYK